MLWVWTCVSSSLLPVLSVGMLRFKVAILTLKPQGALWARVWLVSVAKAVLLPSDLVRWYKTDKAACVYLHKCWVPLSNSQVFRHRAPNLWCSIPSKHVWLKKPNSPWWHHIFSDQPKLLQSPRRHYTTVFTHRGCNSLCNSSKISDRHPIPFSLPSSERWSGCPRAGLSQTAGSPRSRGSRFPGSPPSVASPRL